MTTEAKELSISNREFFQHFPDEEVATEWFEKQRCLIRRERPRILHA